MGGPSPGCKFTVRLSRLEAGGLAPEFGLAARHRVWLSHHCCGNEESFGAVCHCPIRVSARAVDSGSGSQTLPSGRLR